MNRAKTFDATGIAPNGRLFAGDLNLIQDLAAALADFAQNLQVSSIAIGDSSLGITKSGTGQISISALLNILSGMQPGNFTTTTRDTIAAGKRPKGLLIFNTTTNQFEANLGTDAAPSWQAISVGGGGVITGAVDAAGTIVRGTGFTVLRTSQGHYTVTFTTPFSAPPTVVANAKTTPTFVNISAISTTQFSVILTSSGSWSGPNADQDDEWYFLVRQTT